MHLILTAVQQDRSLVVGTIPCGYSLEVPKADGGRKRERGYYLTVWKHVGDGWRIAFAVFSGSVPPSAATRAAPTGEKP